MDRAEFNRNVESLFDEFRKRVIEKGAEYAFDNAYDINRITAIKDYLIDVGDECVEKLYPYSISILAELTNYENECSRPMYTNRKDFKKMVTDYINNEITGES